MSTYEILFKSGASVVLHNVNITMSSENREIIELNFKRGVIGDRVPFIDIGEIDAVVKRQDVKRRWWERS
jgi:hypothetical protein